MGVKPHEGQRAVIEAIELCKLHDLYPGKKLKIESQQEKNNQFIEYEEVEEAEVE